MKSRVSIAALAGILGLSLVGFIGPLSAAGSGSKGCPMGGMMGEKGNNEMCQKMKEHQAAVRSAVEQMGQHLDAMKEVRDEKEWRQEMEKHMAMLQGLLEEMANCPMHKMMGSMMEGKMGHGEGMENGSEGMTH
jgi:hypothetical protein